MSDLHEQLEDLGRTISERMKELIEAEHAVELMLDVISRLADMAHVGNDEPWVAAAMDAGLKVREAAREAK